MIRISTLSLAVLVAFGASAAHADDLVQVYKQARASDPTLAGAEATKLATDENVDQARSALLPQISAALDLTRSDGGQNGLTYFQDPNNVTKSPGPPLRGTSTTSYQRSIGATLNQSILDISEWTALKSSKYTAQAGAATYDAAQQQLSINAATAYFGV